MSNLNFIPVSKLPFPLYGINLMQAINVEPKPKPSKTPQCITVMKLSRKVELVYELLLLALKNQEA